MDLGKEERKKNHYIFCISFRKQHKKKTKSNWAWQNGGFWTWESSKKRVLKRYFFLSPFLVKETWPTKVKNDCELRPLPKRIGFGFLRFSFCFPTWKLKRTFIICRKGQLSAKIDGFCTEERGKEYFRKW